MIYHHDDTTLNAEYLHNKKTITLMYFIALLCGIELQRTLSWIGSYMSVKNIDLQEPSEGITLTQLSHPQTKEMF